MVKIRLHVQFHQEPLATDGKGTGRFIVKTFIVCTNDEMSFP